MGSISLRWGRLCLGLGILLLLLSATASPAAAQDQDMEQLILDINKLAQFKQILSDMKTGYSILFSGYETIRGIAQGNFSLHQAFLDGLNAVSPVVRDYVRVKDILSDEERILSGYKTAYAGFVRGNLFNPHELDYMMAVYNQLTKQALQEAVNLADVLTASKMRMSDAERLSAIDRIYRDTNDRLVFLESFNRKAAVLQAQRQRELADQGTLKNLFRK